MLSFRYSFSSSVAPWESEIQVSPVEHIDQKPGEHQKLEPRPGTKLWGEAGV